MKLALISLTAVFAAHSPLFAQEPLNKVTIFKTGNHLYAACEADLNAPAGLIEFGNCMGYIQGSVDSYMTFRAETKQSSCLAPGVKGVQVRDMVIAYLRDNPGQRHLTASNLVVQAITPLIVECP